MYCYMGRSLLSFCMCFFFKQETAYEMRISDWSSDVCSSDLALQLGEESGGMDHVGRLVALATQWHRRQIRRIGLDQQVIHGQRDRRLLNAARLVEGQDAGEGHHHVVPHGQFCQCMARSEEHTSELQSLMRTSYAVFCLNKK